MDRRRKSNRCNLSWAKHCFDFSFSTILNLLEEFLPFKGRGTNFELRARMVAFDDVHCSQKSGPNSLFPIVRAKPRPLKALSQFLPAAIATQVKGPCLS